MRRPPASAGAGSMRSTSSAQALGQSCGQTLGTRSKGKNRAPWPCTTEHIRKGSPGRYAASQEATTWSRRRPGSAAQMGTGLRRCDGTAAGLPRRDNMTFALTPEQLDIRAAVTRLCERFGDEYWLRKDDEGGFPHEFHRAMAEAGWLGIAMPEAYGGSGLGITEAAILMQAVAESGAGFSGASAIHMNIFGLHPVVVFGNDEQKQRFLPPLIAGKEKTCFAVTEPDAGLDTTRLKTRAVREGDSYVLTGRKIWISTAQVAEKMLILARTTPIEEVARPSLGMTLFYTDLDRSVVEVREIPKMGRKAVDSNLLFIDGLKVPVHDRIGEEGKAFHYILHRMNPERIPIAAV